MFGLIHLSYLLIFIHNQLILIRFQFLVPLIILLFIVIVGFVLMLG